MKNHKDIRCEWLSKNKGLVNIDGQVYPCCWLANSFTLRSIFGNNVKEDYPDEMVFITYHQINELIFKMILWEIQQVADSKNLSVDLFEDKIMRVSRYFDMLTTSFNIMLKGMSVEQYNKFRLSLSPASGFQSFQYRLIEFASTELINLIDIRFRKTIDRNTPFEHAFDHLYWQAAGKDFKTGKKSGEWSAWH